MSDIWNARCECGYEWGSTAKDATHHVHAHPYDPVHPTVHRKHAPDPPDLDMIEELLIGEVLP
jgi:hypothetical protein